MYKSYTLNSYLNSMKPNQAKDQPQEPTNKSQNSNSVFTFPDLSSKNDSRVLQQQSSKVQAPNLTPVKNQGKLGSQSKTQNFSSQVKPYEPIRYQKVSHSNSFTSNSQSKQVEPMKHPILNSSNAMKLGTDNKEPSRHQTISSLSNSYRLSSESKNQQDVVNANINAVNTNTNPRTQIIRLTSDDRNKQQDNNRPQVIRLTSDNRNLHDSRIQQQDGNKQSNAATVQGVQSRQEEANRATITYAPSLRSSMVRAAQQIEDQSNKTHTITHANSLKSNPEAKDSIKQEINQKKFVQTPPRSYVHYVAQPQNKTQNEGQNLNQNQTTTSQPQTLIQAKPQTPKQTQPENETKNHLNYQTKPQTPISQSHYQQQPQQQQDIPSKPATPSKQPIQQKQTYSPAPANSHTQSQAFKIQNLSHEQSTLFSQFKLRYDQLKMNYDRLRQQFDDVNRQKKKMEIKIMNSNPQYYEKEIKRLRAEVQKYQEENQDNKYKFLQAENGKKQFEASFKVKQEELKNMIKQLEKEKVSNVELKHQNEEKERVFARIRAQFEKSNELALKNYDQAVGKFNKFDGALKTRNAQYQNLQKNFQRSQRRLSQLKQQYKKYKEVTQQKLKTLSKNLQSKISQSQKSRQEQTSRIQQLEYEIQQYQAERVSAQLLKTRKSQQVSIIKSNRQLELDVVRLEDRVRFLEFQLVQKDQIVVELQKTIEKLKLGDEVKELEEKMGKMREERMDVERESQRVKVQLQRQIDRLRLQLMNAPQTILHSGNQDFQNILKIQLEQNSKLKRQLSSKIDEIYNLKSDMDELKTQKQNLLSQIDVLKKIKKSQQKNVKIQAQIASQHIKNDMESYKRKIDMLEAKLNMKAKEVKDKDNFIMNSLLGRSKPEETPLVLADFQRIFEASYVDKLAQANQRIEDLMAQRK